MFAFTHGSREVWISPNMIVAMTQSGGNLYRVELHGMPEWRFVVDAETADTADELSVTPDTELNCPLMQLSPYGTEKPHPPQLSGSVCRSTHFPRQRDMPSEHPPMTGRIPELWGLPAVLSLPDSGDPERTKNADPAMMNTMTSIPSTLTGDNTTLVSPGISGCPGSATGD